MNCREFTEFLDGYFDGNLPDAERDVFDEHLAECPDCRAYLQTYRTTVRLGRAAFAPEAAAPADAPEDLIQAILAARGKRK
jgi:anti-sigma factor RsiW